MEEEFRFDDDYLSRGNWGRRTKLAGQLIKDLFSNRKFTIADIGCGSMGLEDVLKEKGCNFDYIPIDLVKRDERTIVLDMNKPESFYRIPSADIIVALGVLEHLDDAPYFLNRLLIKIKYSRTKYVIVSYFMSTLKRKTRRKNNYTLNGFLEIVSKLTDKYVSTKKQHVAGKKRQKSILVTLKG